MLCARGKAPGLGYLIANYFSASRPCCSILDLLYLLVFLKSDEREQARKHGLSSKNRAVFEKHLLEQRLCDEISMVFDCSDSFLWNQILARDSNVELFKELHPSEEEASQGDLSRYGFFKANEVTIHNDLKKIRSQFDELLPSLLSKLILIPENIATDCLKMVNITNFDEDGSFLVPDIVAPGVKLKVLDYSALFKDHGLLQDLKPDHIIMFDQHNYWIRHLQFGEVLASSAKLDIIVGSEYLEGWLYRKKDEREDQTFIKLTQRMGSLHSVRSSASDRVKLDSGLKLVSRLEQQNKSLGVSSINADGPVVLVDKREFNSDCPGLLYFNGYKVLPMFLKTGDYILSNEIVVERKVAFAQQAFEDFKSSLLAGRLDSQIGQMKAAFSRIYILVEIFQGNSLEALNNFLNNRKIAERISVYKTTRMTSRFVLNLAGLVQLYKERHPTVTFFFSFSPEDSLAYFKYLKKSAKDLDVSNFGDFSKKMENKSKKLMEYFDDLEANQGRTSHSADAAVDKQK